MNKIAIFAVAMAAGIASGAQASGYYNDEVVDFDGFNNKAFGDYAVGSAPGYTGFDCNQDHTLDVYVLHDLDPEGQIKDSDIVGDACDDYKN